MSKWSGREWLPCTEDIYIYIIYIILYSIIYKYIFIFFNILYIYLSIYVLLPFCVKILSSGCCHHFCFCSLFPVPAIPGSISLIFMALEPLSSGDLAPVLPLLVHSLKRMCTHSRKLALAINGKRINEILGKLKVF